MSRTLSEARNLSHRLREREICCTQARDLSHTLRERGICHTRSESEGYVTPQEREGSVTHAKRARDLSHSLKELGLFDIPRERGIYHTR
jgi:arginine repressor